MEELNWKDIKLIVNITDALVEEEILEGLPEELSSEEKYYTEILNRYVKQRNS